MRSRGRARRFAATSARSRAPARPSTCSRPRPISRTGSPATAAPRPPRFSGLARRSRARAEDDEDGGVEVDGTTRCRFGFFEELSVLNHGTEPIRPEIAIAVGADFADLFEVKDATIEKPGKTLSRIEDGMLVLGYERAG